MPGDYRSEELAAALIERVRGQRVLLARADRGRELLRDELAAVAEVEQVAVYRRWTREPDPEMLERLRRGGVDYVTLTSSNIARAHLRPLDAEGLEHVRGGPDASW